MISDEKSSQQNVFRMIYINLLHQCAQLQTTLKFVMDRILRNSRGYLKVGPINKINDDLQDPYVVAYNLKKITARYKIWILQIVIFEFVFRMN